MSWLHSDCLLLARSVTLPFKLRFVGIALQEKRLYLDYNATWPRSNQFALEQTISGVNPSSVHKSGKSENKILQLALESISRLFNLSKEHQLVFHSGASEGVNMAIKGHALALFKNHKQGHYLFAQSDHSCVLSQADFLKLLGHKVSFYPVDDQGQFKKDDLKKLIQSHSVSESFLNFTWVNNETGVCWPLELALELKNDHPQLFIHVDGAQAPFKICGWKELEGQLDMYTFSAHKFAGPKGVGFSFIQQQSDLYPLIQGGSQQNGRRSGTMGVLGVVQTLGALEKAPTDLEIKALQEFKHNFEKELLQRYSSKIKIPGLHACMRSSNTLPLVLPLVKASQTFAAFDFKGVDIGVGAACSSQNFKPSKVLVAMGYDEHESSSGVRISFCPDIKMAQLEKAQALITNVLDSLLE